MLGAAVLLLVLLLNMIGFQLSVSLQLYVNMAPEDYYTLSGATDSYFDRINPNGDEVTVSLCLTEEELTGNPTYGRIYDTLQQFADRYDFFQMRLLNLFSDYDEINRLLSMQRRENDEDSSVVETISGSAVIFSSEQTGLAVVRALSTFYVYDSEDSSNQQMVFVGEEITAACVSLTLAAERPKVYFTSGHGESATSSLQNALYMAGYDIVVADISRQDIPSDCALLVIAAPYYDFEEYADPSLVSEITRLRRYLDGGGTVWIFRAPGATNLTRLDSLCAEYGLSVQPGQLIKDNSESLNTAGTTLLLRQADNEMAAKLWDTLHVPGSVRVQKESKAAIGRAGTLTLSDTEKARTYSLLQTSPNAVVYDSEGNKVADPGSQTVCALSQLREGNGQLVLFSSAGFASTELMESDGYLNKDILFALAQQGGRVSTPIGCGVQIINAYPLEGLTRGVSFTWLAILGGGVPLVTALCGVVVCLRRRAR